MPDDALAQNIDYLCSFYPSIADVCRRIGINRQQFNKYLRGSIRPSRRNMRRICDFFGVTEAEILLEPKRLAEIVTLRKPHAVDGRLSSPTAHIEAIYRESKSLDRYVGYYFRYFYAFDHPGHIVKSLVSLYEKDDRYYWKNIETWRGGTPGSAVNTTKYAGIALFLGERIFILEYEAMLRSSITQAILYPSYQTRISYLRGIQTGAPTSRGRRPGASLVVLEYLGRTTRLREALRSCGLYPDGDPAIPPGIRELIANRVADTAWVLEAEEI